MLDSLVVSVGVDYAPLVAGLKTAEQLVSKFVHVVTQQIEQSLSSIDAGAKLADRLATPYQGLKRLQYAAEASGSSIDTMNMSLEHMERSIGKAALGDKQLVATLDFLNIKLEKLVTMGADEQFTAIAESIAKIKSPAQQAALAQELLGKSSQTLLNLIQSGAIGELSEEYDRLHGVLSRGDAGLVEAFNDQITRLKTVSSGVFDKLTAELSGFGQALIQSAFDAGLSADSIGKVFDGLGEKMVRWADFAYKAIQGVVGAAKAGAQILQGIGQVFPALGGLGGGLQGALDLGGKLADATNLATQLSTPSPWAQKMLDSIKNTREGAEEKANKRMADRGAFNGIIPVQEKTIPLGFAQNLSSFAGTGAGQIEALKAAGQRVQQVEDAGATKELVGIAKKLDNVGKVK